MSSSSHTHLLPSSASIMSKFGYIALGLIIGYCSSESGRRSLWNPTVRFNTTESEEESPWFFKHHHDDYDEEGLSHPNGKSFAHALPFEDAFPGMKVWADSLPTFLTEESKLLSESSPFGAFLMGASSSSSSSNSNKHLLYLVHPTAVTLLYDTSKSSNVMISEYSLDYFLLNSGGFDAQINQAYCGVATVSALLNSLKYMKRFRDVDDISGWTFDLPVDQRYDPYPYATQKDILLGDCVRNNVIQEGDDDSEGGTHVDGIFKPPYGLNMAQVADLLRCHTSDEWEVTVHEVDPSKTTLSKMRFDLTAALIDPDARVMINYHRQGLGQVGGGHFSPLGSYHPPTDSFLIMDVAKYKYPPVWVGAATLFSSLSTLENCAHYDYPKAQERLVDNKSDGSTNHLFNPLTADEYVQSLNVLGCEAGYRGYVILKKK
uniref:glutathione gamma-glutamylcysteinyltransferase n=1 Tax=Skeletonema marinoi TaxID=267567 RepID=A0A7S2Q442_9STRA